MRSLASTLAAALIIPALVIPALVSASVTVTADAGQPQAARPPQAGQQQSPIVVAPPIVDLGVVEPGSTSPAKFTIINGGKTPVTVTKVQPNCTCTAISDIAGQTIAPGATIELTASLAAPQAPGIKEAVVFITFDSAPPAQAKIKGDIRLKVVAEPPYVDALKEVTGGTVKLRSADGKPFTVRQSGGKPPVFVGFDPAKDAPRAEYELAWSLAGRACEEMPLWWFVWTDRTDCAVIPLRVRDECTGSKHDMARMQRFWIVKESLVSAGSVHNGTPKTIELELEHYNPARKGAVERPDWNQVKGVRSLIPGVEVAFKGKRDLPNAAVLAIEVNATKGGMFEGEIEIETATGKGRVPFALFATTW